MKLVISHNLLDRNVDHFLRRNGYFFIYDKKMDKGSYSMPLSNNRYPRLHLYVKDRDSDVVLDLHLDQKEVSYKGSNMHNAEYDGEVVESEIARLKSLLGGGVIEKSFKTPKQPKSEDSKKGGLIDTGDEAEKKLGQGNLDLEEKNDADRSNKWWKFW